MLLFSERPAESSQPTPAPATIPEAQSEADAARAQAAGLATSGTSAVDALASYLAVESLPDADTITAAIDKTLTNLQARSADAQAAADACRAATTQDDALVQWRAAVAARDAAQSESQTLEQSIGQAERAPVVAGLDTAAKILIATFTTITAALTAAGFAAGDVTSFYRNHQFWAFLYLILAAIAILVGTFAFLVDSVEAQWKMRLEQWAIYGGVIAFGAAFIIAVWGLAAGASAGLDRPVLSAQLTGSPSSGTTITASASRSAVQRSDTLVTSIWGVSADGKKFVPLRYDVVGASSDGSVSDSLGVAVASGTYGRFVVTAVVRQPPHKAASAPPGNCLPPGTSGGAPVDANLACAILTP